MKLTAAVLLLACALGLTALAQVSTAQKLSIKYSDGDITGEVEDLASVIEKFAKELEVYADDENYWSG